ncbi:hypothetical protein MFIFM68171_02768 [Madurella fahalii]|uniref:ATP-dependent DNA ligase family profile domain-containing protein n=1 Tax=Madurella fahalii TaxID=1157608 RepID=A0ABQ0G466_9PEZI
MERGRRQSRRKSCVDGLSGQLGRLGTASASSEEPSRPSKRFCVSLTISQDCTEDRKVHVRRLYALGNGNRPRCGKRSCDDGDEDVQAGVITPPTTPDIFADSDLHDSLTGDFAVPKLPGGVKLRYSDPDGNVEIFNKPDPGPAPGLYQPPVESDVQYKPVLDTAARSRSTIRRALNEERTQERRRRLAAAAHSNYEARRGPSGLPPTLPPLPAVPPATTDSSGTRSGSEHGRRALRNVANRMGMLDDRVIAMFGERWAHLHAESNPSPLREDDSEPSPILTTAAVDSDFLPRRNRLRPERTYALSNIRFTQAPNHPSRSVTRSPAGSSRARRRESILRIDTRSSLNGAGEGSQPHQPAPGRRPWEFEAADFDGLGNRNRSLSPEGDNVWDTLLSTLTLGPQPPSVGSSFASPLPRRRPLRALPPSRPVGTTAWLTKQYDKGKIYHHNMSRFDRMRRPVESDRLSTGKTATSGIYREPPAGAPPSTLQIRYTTGIVLAGELLQLLLFPPYLVIFENRVSICSAFVPRVVLLAPHTEEGEHSPEIADAVPLILVPLRGAKPEEALEPLLWGLQPSSLLIRRSPSTLFRVLMSLLKGCDDPYFSLDRSKARIKLKKDYIPGFGDTADLIVVGGRRDARDEQEIGAGKLWWTSFYIGCVENKGEAVLTESKPRLRIIDTIDRHCISKADIVHLNRHGYFRRPPFAESTPEFDIMFERGQRP